jgi:hypothetical protein
VVAVTAASPSSLSGTASLRHRDQSGAEERFLRVVLTSATPFVCVCSTHLFLLTLNIDDA